MQFMAKQAPRHFFSMKTKQISDYHPLPPNHYLPPLALLMEKCYVSMCFSPKPCFQEMVENEKLTQACTYAFAGKIALTPFFNHAKFLLLAELPVIFLKPYNLSQMQGKFQDWFVGKKKDPSLPLTKIIWSLSDFTAQYKACSPLDLPAVKKAWIQTTNKQKRWTWEWWIGKLNSSFNFVFNVCIQ